MVRIYIYHVHVLPTPPGKVLEFFVTMRVRTRIGASLDLHVRVTVRVRLKG